MLLCPTGGAGPLAGAVVLKAVQEGSAREAKEEKGG